MKQHPIIFSGPMVRAILEGRKTQTRRVMKPQPENNGALELVPGGRLWYEWPIAGGLDHFCQFPYGQVGDRLWIRENFQITQPWGSDGDEWIGDDLMEIDGRLPHEKPEEIGFWWQIQYKADDPETCRWWRPSIFMPRWASRIDLEIVNVRVEQIQRITIRDAAAEGIDHTYKDALDMVSVSWYQDLWNDLNGKRGFGWSENPFVWVIEFKTIKRAE